MNSVLHSEEKRNIGSLFDRIAVRYDFLNHLLSLNIDRYWRYKGACAIKTEEGCVLDVAIGTADFAIAIAKRHENLRVCGIDLSQEMMRIGEEKVGKMLLSDRISFMRCSAQEMPMTDNSYDVVSCAYGVRNFADLRQGLSEMYRVLKSGGELVILEFSYPKNRLVAWIYNLYFSHILPFVGGVLSRDKKAYLYLNKSVQNFIWGDRMCEELRRVGFREVEYRSMSLGITMLYKARK